MSKYAKVDLVAYRRFDAIVKLLINANLQSNNLKKKNCPQLWLKCGVAFTCECSSLLIDFCVMLTGRRKSVALVEASSQT